MEPIPGILISKKKAVNLDYPWPRSAFSLKPIISHDVPENLENTGSFSAEKNAPPPLRSQAGPPPKDSPPLFLISSFKIGMLSRLWGMSATWGAGRRYTGKFMSDFLSKKKDLYKTHRWRKRRQAQIALQPFFVMRRT